MRTAVNPAPPPFPESEALAQFRRKRKRSRELKRSTVIGLLLDAERAAYSDRLIATKARVSQTFVSNIRRELSKNVLSVRATKRRGADGVIRNVSKIGRRPIEQQRHFVLHAIHAGAWTIRELMDESKLGRSRLQEILDGLLDADIIIRTARKTKTLNGGRPELLYMPKPNLAPEK
jgi:predicted transcriptional regulator